MTNSPSDLRFNPVPIRSLMSTEKRARQPAPESGSFNPVPIRSLMSTYDVVRIACMSPREFQSRSNPVTDVNHSNRPTPPGRGARFQSRSNPVTDVNVEEQPLLHQDDGVSIPFQSGH